MLFLRNYFEPEWALFSQSLKATFSLFSYMQHLVTPQLLSLEAIDLVVLFFQKKKLLFVVFVVFLKQIL